MVVHTDGQDFFGPFLTNDIAVQFVAYGPGGGNIGRAAFGSPTPLLLIHNRLAKLYALAADIHISGTLDQRPNVPIGLPTEGAVRVPVAWSTGGRFLAVALSRVFGRHARSYGPHHRKEFRREMMFMHNI